MILESPLFILFDRGLRSAKHLSEIFNGHLLNGFGMGRKGLKDARALSVGQIVMLKERQRTKGSRNNNRQEGEKKQREHEAKESRSVRHTCAFRICEIVRLDKNKGQIASKHRKNNKEKEKRK